MTIFFGRAFLFTTYLHAEKKLQLRSRKLTQFLLMKVPWPQIDFAKSKKKNYFLNIVKVAIN